MHACCCTGLCLNCCISVQLHNLHAETSVQSVHHGFSQVQTAVSARTMQHQITKEFRDINNSTMFAVAVCSRPFPLTMIKEALYKVRGDLYAGAMKLHADVLSIPGELRLLVDEKDGDEIWNLTEGDSVEVGAFQVCVSREQKGVDPFSGGLKPSCSGNTFANMQTWWQLSTEYGDLLLTCSHIAHLAAKEDGSTGIHSQSAFM